jgi:ATP-binding cassette subfamily B protein
MHGAAAPHLRKPGRFIAHYLMERRLVFSSLLLALIAAACCAVCAQYQMKRLVDAMALAVPVPGSVWLALALFVVLMGLESVFLRVSARLTCNATVGAGVQMRLDLFEYLGGQSMNYFASNLAGSLGQRITGTAGNFGALANTAAWRVVPPVIDFMGALIIFTTINWRMAIGLGGCVLTATAGLMCAGERGRHWHRRYFALASQTAGHLTDVISNMWAVKAFCARSREWARLKSDFEMEASAQRRSWLYTENTRIFYEAVVWVVAVLMSVWAVWSWTRGSISPGAVVIITALTFRILHGARDVALALVDIGQQIGYIEDTLSVIGQTHSLLDPPAATVRSRRDQRGRGSIEFRNVTFGYEPGRPVLCDLTLRIGAGEKVGIVGPSGAGKTTLVQLIQRLHDPQWGHILIDGRRSDLYSQDSLRETLSVVPQEISLFHRSIRENIRFGRPGATDEEVLQAARAAGCGFVESLPDGFDTLVGERGSKLSGGQRQRIGIARAFLKDAPFLILDEATSALDTASELTIQRHVTERMPGRTVVAVAHRISTVLGFDRIVVIDQGRVVEQGSPEYLRRHGTIFRQLWQLQTSGLSGIAAVPGEGETMRREGIR